MTTFAGYCEMTLYCPGAFSLKDKRQSIRSLIDRAREDYNVSAAEVNFQDRHRLSQVAFSTVSSSKTQVEKIFDNLEKDVSQDPEIQIREIERTLV